MNSLGFEILSVPTAVSTTTYKEDVSRNTQADDDTLSISSDDVDVHALLLEAETRMREKANSQSSKEIWTKFPKLDPGSLPNKYIDVRDGTAVAAITKDDAPVLSKVDKKLARQFLKVEDPVKIKKDMKEKKDKTAGPDWFNLPRTDLTPQIKRDLQILKLRNVLDPKKHFKKADSKDLPKYAQVGTVIEGPTDFHSSRIKRKDRQKNFVDEILSSKEGRTRFKKKYNEIQGKKKSGRKEHYKKLKARRQGRSTG